MLSLILKKFEDKSLKNCDREDHLVFFINIKCDQVCHFEKCNCGQNDNEDHDRECAQDLSSNFVS